VSPSVHVIGAGLLGTSVGLALSKAGWSVSLSDRDPAAERLAADLGAGSVGAPAADPDLVVVAVPPSGFPSVASELSREYLSATVTDVLSTKSVLLPDVERFALSDRFVGGHPMAGSERSGPQGARADLFEGRPWVLCPSAGAPRERVDAVVSMVTACGARPVEMTPLAHDAAVARVSHAPQVAASLLAAQLLGADQQQLTLAGQGLRDTSRIAASDPDLWVEILAGNAGPVADVLEGLSDDLQEALAALRMIERVDKSTKRHMDNSERGAARDGLRAALQRGREGHQLIPGKHGAPAMSYAVIPVVIPDEPGALARLFASAGEAGINIEDIAIEHSPGQPVGLVELSVAPDSAPALSEALVTMGWSVH